MMRTKHWYGSWLRKIAPWAMGVLAFVLTTVRFDAGAQKQDGSGSAPPAAAIEEQVKRCEPCHGPNGASQVPQYPILAGQEMYYTYLQLQDFRAGRRSNPQMAGMLDDLSKDDLRALAEYFAVQSWPRHSFDAGAQTIARATSAMASGQCSQCHTGGYIGNSSIPRLAGQYPDYLRTTMLDYKHDRRTNSPAMASLMETFSKEDIEAMAAYLAQLQPQPGR
jgi:cytochrome c553